MTPLRLVFLGSDGIALPLLNWLTGEGRELAAIVGVYTQPDRAVGRGQKVRPNAIKNWALERGLPVFQPEKIADEIRTTFAVLQPDVALVMAYGHILRDDFIATPRLGTLNLHASLLPKYRGASPIQTAIANGERETGVSLMRIVRRLDAGPVADIERLPINMRDTALEVEAKLAAACVPLLVRALPKLAAGSLQFNPQEESGATYCRRLTKEDGAFDFHAPAAVLAARINGLFPWPACSFELDGLQIRIGLAESSPETTGKPGVVFAADSSGLCIGTGSGTLKIMRLQRPGGRMLAALEFLRGHPIAAGTDLESSPMRALVASTPFNR